MLIFCKHLPAHQNREENVNKKHEIKTILIPDNDAKILIGGEPCTKMCIYEINEIICVLMFP